MGQQAQNSLQEQNQKLVELTEAHRQRKARLDSQEQSLTEEKEEMGEIMSKMEEEQCKLNDKETKLQKELSNLRLWEEQLEQVTNHLLQGNGGESSRVSVLSSLESRQHQHQDDLDSLQGIEDSFRR